MNMNDLKVIEGIGRRYRYTWLVFGSAFIALSYNLSGRNGSLNVAFPLIFVALYATVGNFVGLSIGQRVVEAIPEAFSYVLFGATMKLAILCSIVSMFLHLALIFWIHSLDPSSVMAARAPDFRNPIVAIAGSAVFPLLANIAAAATLGRA